MSRIRKKYILKLIFRCAVLVLSAIIFFVHPESFEIAEGMNFFKSFSVFHILWVIWMANMLLQILPVKSALPLGSRKLQSSAFRPAKAQPLPETLKKYTATTARSAYLVMLLWAALIAVIGILYYTGIIDRSVLMLISVAFYVCDLICVLIWCPFRVIMKTKCCTTCRIFNWDHMMMFSPMIFIWSFYSVSLWVMALISFALWEISIFIHPERFWEATNTALQCSECTDKLCTQYCQKLRK